MLVLVLAAMVSKERIAEISAGAYRECLSENKHIADKMIDRGLAPTKDNLMRCNPERQQDE